MEVKKGAFVGKCRRSYVCSTAIPYVNRRFMMDLESRDVEKWAMEMDRKEPT